MIRRPLLTNPFRRLTSPALPAAVALVLAAGGCGGSALATSSSSSTTEAGATVHIVMRNLFFHPSAVSAKVGQRVVWTNEDVAAHNITYVSGPRFRSSRLRLGRGAQFSITLNQPGTIHYVCTLHPWMKATIVVSPS